MILIGIFGSGGYAREVMPVARQAATARFEGEKYKLVFVVVDVGAQVEVNGHQVMSEQEFYASDATQKYFNIAIADSRLRQRIADEAIAKGIVPFECRASNVVIMDSNEIGEGAVFSPSVIVTSNAKIGRFFHANLFSYVAHDCVIGDFVTFAPNVHCNGNVIIHDHAYIGTGVIIKHGSPGKPVIIGEGAVVGMGAVVTKSVAPGALVVGNPARPLDKN